MAVRTRAELNALLVAFTDGGMNTAAEFRTFVTDLLDTLAFATAIRTDAQITNLAQAAALARYTNAEKTKLADVEDDATADQTGAEIVALLNAQLGNMNWQSGGGMAADGVLSGVVFNNDGTVDFTRTEGAALQANMLAAVQAIAGALDNALAPLAGATFTGAVKGIAPAADEDLTRKDYVDGQIAALAARVAALEGQVDTSDHIRYFGWSPDRVIETADFAGATQATSNDSVLPAHASNDYIWFAVPESEGAPSHLYIAGSNIDSLPNFDQLAATVDDDQGTAHIVFVSQREFVAAVYTGAAISIEY